MEKRRCRDGVTCVVLCTLSSIYLVCVVFILYIHISSLCGFYTLYICIYVIRQCHLLVPAGPRATGKRKAGSITSGYLVKRGKTCCLVSWRVTSKSWLVCCDSRFGLPRQSSEGSYRSRRPALHAARATYM